MLHFFFMYSEQEYFFGLKKEVLASLNVIFFNIFFNFLFVFLFTCSAGVIIF